MTTLKNKIGFVNRNSVHVKTDNKFITEEVIYKKDVKETVLDLNYFMKYLNTRKLNPFMSEKEQLEIISKISVIMEKYNMKSKPYNEDWTFEEISKLILGDFEK